MNTSPKVSVIVPIYNGEQYLSECIESLVAQTYQPLEIVLIDDGSTDSSGKICDNYARDYSNIVVLHTSNQGRTNARITGVEKSQGDYVAFVDADDYVATEYIEHMVLCLFEHNVEIACCNSYLIRGNKRALDKRTRFGFFDANLIQKMFNTDFLYDDETGRSSIAHYLCCKLYQKKTILSALPVGKDIWDGEDVVTLFYLLQYVKSLYLSDRPLYFYRQHEGQTTKIFNRRRWNILVKVFQTLEGLDKNNYLDGQLSMFIFSKLRDWGKGRFSQCENYKEFKSDLSYALEHWNKIL